MDQLTLSFVEFMNAKKKRAAFHVNGVILGISTKAPFTELIGILSPLHKDCSNIKFCFGAYESLSYISNTRD